MCKLDDSFMMMVRNTWWVSARHERRPSSIIEDLKDTMPLFLVIVTDVRWHEVSRAPGPGHSAHNTILGTQQVSNVKKGERPLVSLSHFPASHVCVRHTLLGFKIKDFGRPWWSKRRPWWLKGRPWWPKGRPWWSKGRPWWPKWRPWWAMNYSLVELWWGEAPSCPQGLGLNSPIGPFKPSYSIVF